MRAGRIDDEAALAGALGDGHAERVEQRVVVFGGPARLRYLDVAPLRQAEHPFAGACRINLTLRRAA